MDCSIESFICTSENEQAVHVMKSLCIRRSEAMRVLIEGPRLSGKSTLLCNSVGDLERIGKGVFMFCTGADIKMNLELDCNEDFFDDLGAKPILLIDSPELVLLNKAGDKLIALLIEERDKHGFDTVLAIDKPLEECGFKEALASLEGFQRVPIAPLGMDGRCRYVQRMLDQYRREESPEIDPKVISFIADSAEDSFFHLEAAARFLMEEAELDGGKKIITLAVAKELLS